MIGISYCGSLKDPSGYGDSNRADVAALFAAGVDVKTETVTQTLHTTTNGWVGSLADHLEGREIDYKIKIIHLTPDLYPKYMEDGKYHIGRLVWETDKLPKVWIEPINKMNEIWTMTEAQKEVIKNSGVNVPIHVFPEPLDITNGDKKTEPLVIPNYSGVIFYAMFQWIERKDPYSLLTTYWKTFEGYEDVILLLKTFRVAYSDTDFAKIKEDIARWKAGLKQKHYPRVGLIRDLWPTEKVWQFHKMGGVFLSASHGEGWGRPMVEASLLGNPVVSIDRTGFADVFPKDVFYPVNCAPSPVVPQSWISWYQKDQNWLNIDTKDLGAMMLSIYKDQQEAKERGEKAKQFVKVNLNYWTVGNSMKQRLEEIYRFL